MSASDSRPILIVGQGIAGTVLGNQLKIKGIDFRILDDGHQSSSSLAAAGLFNPLILKRQRKSWNADVFMPLCRTFYKSIETDLGIRFFHETGILRRIASVGELNDWDSKKALDGFAPYLGKIIGPSDLKTEIDCGQGLIELLQAGWVDVRKFLDASKELWQAENRYLSGIFNQDEVGCKSESVVYSGEEYSQLILCRGYKEWQDSRFFPDLPFTPAKGQTIIARVPDLALHRPFHAGVFILPLGGQLFRIGSTYSWSNFNETPEESQRQKITEQFETVCTLPYEIIEERAGVRPATKDRRPLIGRSKLDGRIALLNGLGSRGIMIAPYLTEVLINGLQSGQQFPRDLDLLRFEGN